MDVKELVIIGEEDIGKTTLANALLGWDILPQTNSGWHAHTKENTSRMLTDTIRLTDTPGYDLWDFTVPETMIEAVSHADTVVMIFKDFASEEDAEPEWIDLEEAEEYRRWVENLAKEETLLKDLLTRAKTRDIYFVIPFSRKDAPWEQEERERDMVRAKERFASYSDHGEDGFFSIDPMMALIAAIEDDHAALEASGILTLKAALLGREE